MTTQRKIFKLLQLATILLGLLTTGCISEQQEPVSTSSPSTTSSPPPSNSSSPIDSSSQQNPDQIRLPFGNPTELLGQKMDALSQNFQVPLNSAGNLVTETPDYHLLAESKNGVTATFISLDLKQLGTCTQSQESVNMTNDILSASGISSYQLSKLRETPSTGYVVYQLRDIEISTGCLYDGAPYSVGVKYSSNP